MSDVFKGWNLTVDGAEQERYSAASEFRDNNPGKELRNEKSAAGKATGRWIVVDKVKE
jgi:hypothetical protein